MNSALRNGLNAASDPQVARPGRGIERHPLATPGPSQPNWGR